MRMVLSFLLFLVVAGLSGMLVFLNQEKVTLILTPAFGGVYYILPSLPLGLLVVFTFFLGVLIGYILSLLTRLIR
ncbi:MAG: hypothetical protein D6674_05895 [Acidobacteria bacterium]|nr:MAG: hypothetical protein D6674_05895 [Acidobacteriota bacterium]